MAGASESREGIRVGELSAYRDRNDPDSRRHRIHLGQRYAPVVQAREKLRDFPRPAELSSRASDAGLGSLSMSNQTEAEVRAEVREWIAANWNPDMSLLEW